MSRKSLASFALALIALVLLEQLLLLGRSNLSASLAARSIFYPSSAVTCDFTIRTSESVQCLAEIVRSKSFLTSTVLVSSENDLAWLSNATGISRTVVTSNASSLRNERQRSISNHVVLAIPCSEEVPVLSITSLMKMIPGYSYVLTVILAKECEQHYSILQEDSNSTKHQRLQSFLQRAFPFTNVTFIFCNGMEYSTAGNASCLDLLLFKDEETDLLICATPSPECMLVATTCSTAATVVESDEMYPWLSSVPKEKIPSKSFSIFNTDAMDTVFPSAVLESTVNRTSKTSIILEFNNATSRDPTRCNHFRGRLGAWKFDPAYANSSYYYDRWWINAKDYEQRPYSHNSYSWEDHCGMEIMSLQGFCEAMETLGIRRLFTVGDSLQFMSMISFFHLLGFDTDHPHTKGLHHHLRQKSQLSSRTTIQCPSSFLIQVVFHRVNHLTPLLGNSSTGRNLTQREQDYVIRSKADKRFDSMEYYVCYGVRKPLWPDEDGDCPWVADYLRDDVRTLLITGVGAHFHSFEAFKESFDQWIEFLRRHPRPNDIIWYRTVHAGHLGTFNQTEIFESYQQYKEQAWTTTYTWNLFVEYNKYVEEQVFLTNRDETWNGPQMALLDTYWMTVLRKDGHPSPKDGLHYLLPGPPDWWNHLLYSNLRELAWHEAME